MTQEECKALIDKYLAGEATEDEARLVEAFMKVQDARTSILNPGASEEMWAMITSKIEAAEECEPVDHSNGGPKRRNILIACSLIAFLGVLALFVHRAMTTRLDATVKWMTVTSAKGQKSLVTLADGSQVYLNAETSITYPETFGKNKREIVLNGEAFFDVARDETRPFMVRTANMVTRVLGTSFNVKAFKGGVTKVTVLTGRVQVTSGDQTERIVIEPNDQVIFDGESDFVLRTVDVAPYIAWKNRTLYFEDSTLEEVVAELERWYNVKITLQDEAIRYCKINGQYKDIELRNVLKSIQYMYQIEYKFQDQNNIVLYGKGCN